MTSASARLLTLGWSGDQRRALRDFIIETPARVQIMRDRIKLRHRDGVYDGEEATAALEFLDGGPPGYGIVEYEAASLWGADPIFRVEWRRIRRLDPEMAQTVADDPVPARGRPAAAMSIAESLIRSRKRSSRPRGASS